MNIAIINDFNGHLEVIGYIIYLFNKNNNITIFYKSDIYNYINFFEKYFGVIEKKPIAELNEICSNFDKIFVITMNNPIPEYFKEIKHKIYGFLHAYHRKSPLIDNYITFYPHQMKEFKKLINDTNKQYFCTYPFYKIPNTNKFSEKKYILQVGTLWDDDDDLKEFERNIKYKIIYFTKRKNKGINRDMFTLKEYLQNSLFILGRKTWHYPHAFTGSLSLAFSFNVPIILPEFKQKEYMLPCITFTEKYCELIDYINNIDVDDYNKLLKSMDNIKDQEI